MISETIQKHIEKALKKLELPADSIQLEHPSDESHGDCSCNIAMQIFPKRLYLENSSRFDFKRLKSPREFAQMIVDQLNKDEGLKKIVSKIEVAGPGFINFWLLDKFLFTSMAYILVKKDKFGKLTYLKGKKIMVEYTDPNPFKEFHIGHLYSNIVGESIARIFEMRGAIVKRANYQGDIGMHVAKSLWGMQKKIKEENIAIYILEKKPLKDRVAFMGQAYALGATKYKEDENVKKEIELLNKKIYNEDKSVVKLYKLGRVWSLDYFETIYKRLGTKFDHYYFESRTGKEGFKLVQEALKKRIFKKSKGAVVFQGEKYGLHTRVFINSLGIPTYEAKDIGNAVIKYGDFPYDKSIIVTGNEVDEYFKVVLKALRLIKPKLGKKTIHISHGMVRLPEGKMSSRTGKILLGEWMIDEAKKRAVDIMKQNRTDISDEDIETISEIVGLGAIKYALLKSNIGRDIVFNFDESLSFEGNSGPYLQYTYARAKSVLRKSKSQIPNDKTNPKLKTQNLKLTNEELSILRTLYKFPEVVHEAGSSFAPNLIANYLFDLAQKFNLFYQKVPILKAPSSKLKAQRLLLTDATAHVIKNGLYLLGIKTLEKM